MIEADRSTRDLLAAAFAAALAALDPARLVRDALPALPPKRARVRVIAAGKAASGMAAGALERWPDRVDDVLVITAARAAAIDPRVTAIEAAHPVPDEGSVAAAEEALRRASELGSDDLLLALISGGASSLMVAPPRGATLDDERALVASLLDRGTPIRDVNLVRRHFSRVKGGRLALAASRARVLSFIVSDVIDGAPHDIGSGPTVPDPTTLADARAVLARAGIAEPPGMSESLKPDGPARTRSRILADGRACAQELARALAASGLRVTVSEPEEGDARDVVERRLAVAATLSHGEAVVIPCEPTLRLPIARGRGGRAGWIALAAMRRLPPEVTLMCAATDGADGSSGTAGAIVSSGSAASIAGDEIDAALAAFDDARVHRALGTHLGGEPTMHNLADVHALVRR